MVRLRLCSFVLRMVWVRAWLGLKVDLVRRECRVIVHVGRMRRFEDTVVQFWVGSG